MDERRRLTGFLEDEAAQLDAAKGSEDAKQPARILGNLVKWMRSLDLEHGKAGRPYLVERAKGAGELLDAIKYARDRVDHQASEVLLAVAGFALPAHLPAALQELLWLPFKRLPQPDPRHENATGAEAYKKRLEGQPIKFAVAEVLEFFRGLRYAGWSG